MTQAQLSARSRSARLAAGSQRIEVVLAADVLAALDTVRSDGETRTDAVARLVLEARDRKP